MPRRSLRVVAEMPLARINGRRWAVAMCETEWTQFVEGICPAARNRLRAILEHFCDNGDENLPRGCFRWLPPTVAHSGVTTIGAFEARGVVLRGRAAQVDGRPVFFVQTIDVDPPSEPNTTKRRSSRPQVDRRQEQLPFTPPLLSRN